MGLEVEVEEEGRSLVDLRFFEVEVEAASEVEGGMMVSQMADKLKASQCVYGVDKSIF